jgi:predicted O-methyltransferase YrrM
MNQETGSSQKTWSAVDAYFEDCLIGEDPVLESALRDSAEAGLPLIHVAPNQGKLLHLLARIQGARKVLEFGTLGGYSTIWLARALPEDGKLVTLEASPRHAEIARANIARAGLSHLVEIRVGRALELLPALYEESIAPFDLIFIDADKANIPEYVEGSLKLSRPGTIIIVDNVVRSGLVADPEATDLGVRGVHDFCGLIAGNPRLSATAIQTVGRKGYDGFSLAIVTE